MSDYNGPTEQRRVRFTRDWFGVAAGSVVNATYYPELGSYYVPVNGGQHISCVSNATWCEAHPREGRAETPRGAIEWFTFDQPARDRAMMEET